MSSNSLWSDLLNLSDEDGNVINGEDTEFCEQSAEAESTLIEEACQQECPEEVEVECQPCNLDGADKDGLDDSSFLSFLLTATCEPKPNASCAVELEGEDGGDCCEEGVDKEGRNSVDDDEECECEDCVAERDRIDRTHEMFRKCCNPELRAATPPFRNPPCNFNDFKCPKGCELGLEPSWTPQPELVNCDCPECAEQQEPLKEFETCEERVAPPTCQSDQQQPFYPEEEYVCEQEPEPEQCDCEEVVECQPSAPVYEECQPEPEPEVQCVEEEVIEEEEIVEVLVEDIEPGQDGYYCEEDFEERKPL